jgi:predicted HAD superfamily Cof-like phosphohydrolase
MSDPRPAEPPRERFREELGPDTAPELRAEIAAGYASFSERREIWHKLVDSPAIELLRQGKMQEARSALEQSLRA